MGFGMTTVMVSKDDVRSLDEAANALDEAIYMGALTDEEGWPVMEAIRKMRDRFSVALGA